MKFRPTASASEVSAAHRLADADQTQKLANLRSGALWRIRSRSKGADAMATALEKNPHVEYVELNFIVSLQTSPNDPSYGELYGLKNTGQTIGGVAGVPGADIDAESAWSVTRGSSAIVIGVVDTGIDYNHPDLAANIWRNPGGKGNVACAAGTYGYNAIAGTCDPMDDHNHGTHVAGTIGAVGNNGRGVVGVNWIASIMALKFLDSTGRGTTADAVAAIDFAVQAKKDGVNVRVLSNSWGGGPFSKALLEVINEANENDILFVASAGNDGEDNDAFPRYPCGYGAPNVIAVAATGNRDTLASFSNYGPTTVHLGAPGVNILSTIVINRYAMFSGTSMAAPHVSGVAGLLLANTPTLTTAQVKSAILAGTDPIPALEGKTVTGGRLNAAKALGVLPAAGFTLAMTPPSRTIAAGQSATYDIAIVPSNGFSGTVDLSLTEMPSGVTGTFAPNPATTHSTLTVTAAESMQADLYGLIVTGLGGGQRQTYEVTLAVTPAPLAGCPRFSPGFSGYASTRPSAVAIADFDGDGDQDLVSTNLDSARVTIELGDGTGVFAFETTANVGSTPVAVTAGDFNGDGALDVAVANSGSNDVSILLGNGDGTFQGTTQYAAGTTPRAVAAGDLNRDGKVDLAVANHGSGNLSILLGQGDGTFSPVAHYPAGAGAFAVALADLDRNGTADAAVASSIDGSVSVLSGNGDGSFGAPVPYVTAPGSSSVVIADFDRDGDLDLAVANDGAGTMSVLKGNGDGTFAAASQRPIGSRPYALAAGDFNDDGITDLVTANRNSNTAMVLVGQGDGTFVSKNVDAGSAPSHVAVGDLNGDGRPDFVLAETGVATASDSLAVHLNNGICARNCGALVATSPFATGTAPSSVAFGDFNRDGIVDLAIANKDSNSVTIGIGGGRGSYVSSGTVAVGTKPEFVAVADLDRDGNDDLVVANSDSDNVSIVLGHGDGTFATPVAYPAGDAPRSIAIGDFDRDGVSDLAVSNHGSDDVSILLGNGDGTFATPVSFATLADPNGIAAGDLNRDGHLDLVVASGASDAVSVLIANGDGTFQSPVSVSASTTPFAVAIADLDRDGRPDLAVTNSGASTVSVVRGKGDGTFETAVHYAAGPDPRHVIVEDFTDDGLLDLAVTNTGSDRVSILAGTVAGPFAAAVDIATGRSPIAAATSDVNRDGKPDIVTANGTANTVSVLRNTCPRPDLTVTKTHTGSFVQGGTGATYTITVANGGGAPTEGIVTVTDSVPAGLIATSMSGAGWTCTMSTTTCTRSDRLGPGSGYPAITLTVDIRNNAPESVTNTATVSGGGEILISNNTASDPTTIQGATNLVISKTHSGDFAQGTTGRLYTIHVRNAGRLATTGTVTVTDSLPAGLTATAISGSGWNCTLGTLMCTRSDALAEPSAYPAITITVDVAIDAPAHVINTATVSGGGDANPGDNTAADPTVIWSRQACASFGAPAYYAAPEQPQPIAIGDFNGDGNYDLAAGNPAADTVSIMLGQGDGTFGEPATHDAGDHPIWIAAADMDDDGALDLVIPHYYTGTLSVSLGKGDGTFAAPVAYVVAGGTPTRLAIADFNADGILDAATLRTSPASVNVLLGNGDGSLRSAAGYGTAALPRDLVAADFDLDGDTDLVVAGDGGTGHSLLLGNGDGTFADHVLFSGSGSRVATADFNGDGKPDLAFLYSSSVLVRLGNGNGTFQSAVSYNLGFYPSAFTLADISGDGFPDLIMGGYNRIVIRVGKGDGTFPGSAAYAVTASDAKVGDFNGDGKADLAISGADVGVMFGGCPDLTVQKTHSGDFTSSSGQYTIAVSNTGLGSTFGSIKVTDTLPGGLTATQISGSRWVCALATLTCTTNDTLHAGQAMEPIYLTVNVSPSAPANVTNIATVSGGADPNDGNNVAADPTTIVRAPDLRIAKTHGGLFVQGDAGRTYTISVSNVGYSPTAGLVTVTDTIPAGLAAVSIAGTGWDCNLDAGPSCRRSDPLDAGAAYPPITVTVNVNIDAPHTVTNQATVSGGGEPAAAETNNTALDATPILTTPSQPHAYDRSSTSITVAWGSSVHATSYRVLRSSNGGAFTLIRTVSSSSMTDQNLTANTTYVYVVQAAANGLSSPSSKPDIATTIAFTDPSLTAGKTLIRAVHVEELRAAANAVRAAAGLSAASFTDPSLAGAAVKSVHLSELRAAIDQARSALGLAAMQYTDGTLAAGSTPVRLVHITQLRNSVK